MNRNECSCDDNMTKRDSLVLLMRNLDPRAKESAIIRYLLIKAPALWSEKHKPPTKHPVPPRSPLKLLIAGNGKKFLINPECCRRINLYSPWIRDDKVKHQVLTFIEYSQLFNCFENGLGYTRKRLRVEQKIFIIG